MPTHAHTYLHTYVHGVILYVHCCHNCITVKFVKLQWIYLGLTEYGGLRINCNSSGRRESHKLICPTRSKHRIYFKKRCLLMSS